MRKFAWIMGSFSLVLSMAANSDQYGRVRLPGSGTVEHNGDFVVYNLSFQADCYANQATAVRHVSESVLQLVSWLDAEALASQSGKLDYQVDTIQTHRDTAPYLWGYSNDEHREPNPCYQKYSTTQYISIQITKNIESDSISTETIQNFYHDLYLYIWNLNFVEEEDNAHFDAKINGISKGLFESTKELLKEQAYSKASAQATRNLLAILGAGYHGQWFLIEANFTNDRYIYESSVSRDIALAPPMAGSASPIPVPEPVPSIIKLDKLSYSVDGSFEFGFSYDYHNGRP